MIELSQFYQINPKPLQSNLKRGGKRFYPVLAGGGGGGAQKVSDPQFSHFVAPVYVINDQSLGVLLVIIGQLES